MKAVVVEINKKYAIALDKKGAFVKIKNTGNYIVGAEIELPAASVASIAAVRKLSAAAAAVVMVLSLGLGAYGYVTPYSYINIDINPSVEITSNIFDRIIKVEALNSDALKILDTVDYKNKPIKEGVGIILDNAAKEGYLTDESRSAVMITVSGKSENKVEVIKKTIEDKAKSDISKEKPEAKAEIVVEGINIKKHDDARKAGISPGKLLLIERLQEVVPAAKIDEFKDAPVKEILKNIQAARKQEKNIEKGKTEEKPDKANSPSERKDKTEEKKDIKQNPGQQKKSGDKTASPGSDGSKNDNGVKDKDNGKGNNKSTSDNDKKSDSKKDISKGEKDINRNENVKEDDSKEDESKKTNKKEEKPKEEDKDKNGKEGKRDKQKDNKK